ncbi:MAG: galactokinase, partial [Bacteroidota bacterium]
KYKNELDPIDFKRANYIFSENQRVQKMKLALMENNLEEAGKLLLQAQNGYSKEYEVSLPEIDYLIQIAMEHDNILGGRLMGGGFGGATLNIVAKENMEQTFEEMKKKYFARTGINCTVEEIEVGDGVCIIN